MHRLTFCWTLAVLLGVLEPLAGETIFTPPVNLGSTINTAFAEAGPSITADGRTLFFYSTRPGGEGVRSIWTATRSSILEPFGSPTNVAATNSPFSDFGPDISPDGLTLYFVSTRDTPIGQGDVFVTTRSSVNDPFGPPQLVDGVNTSFDDGGPSATADGLTLYFSSIRPGGVGSYDMWVATRASVNDPFGNVMNLGAPVNSTVADGPSTVTADGLTLYFGSARVGGTDPRDLYVSTRATTSDSWGVPANLTAINTPHADGGPNLSPDGLILFFNSDRPGGFGESDIWMTMIPEPSTLTLAGLGMIGLLAYGWRRRRA